LLKVVQTYCEPATIPPPGDHAGIAINAAHS
jgi:hypothetical protein